MKRSLQKKITTSRLIIIDVMQGIAMFFVVLGHHRFDFMPKWYFSLFSWIYTFHMPLFIFISGFLVRYSYRGVYSIDEYWTYVGKRVRKFVPPYLIVGLICTFMAWNFKDVSALLTNLTNLLISPKQSEVTFLWYIYLLFFFYCIAPILFNIKQCWIKLTFFVLCLLLSLRYIHVQFFCIDYLTRYLVFFLLGTFVAENYTKVKQVDVKWTLLTFIVFIVMSLLYFRGECSPFLKYIMQWVAIPSCVCVAWMLKHWFTARKALVYVSVNCFGVYLLHMFVVQVGALIVASLPWTLPSWGYILYLLFSVIVSIVITACIWSYMSCKRCHSR